MRLSNGDRFDESRKIYTAVDNSKPWPASNTRMHVNDLPADIFRHLHIGEITYLLGHVTGPPEQSQLSERWRARRRTKQFKLDLLAELRMYYDCEDHQVPFEKWVEREHYNQYRILFK